MNVKVFSKLKLAISINFHHDCCALYFSAVTKVMTSPLTPEKKSQSNGHASPTYQKTNPGSPSIKQSKTLLHFVQ